MENNPEDNNLRYILNIASWGLGRMAIECCRGLKYLGLAPFGLTNTSLDENNPYNIRTNQPELIRKIKLSTEDKQDIRFLAEDDVNLNDVIGLVPDNTADNLWDHSYARIERSLSKKDKQDIRILKRIKDFDTVDMQDALNNKGIFRDE